MDQPYRTLTHDRLEAYLQHLWAQSGLDNNGEELPPGITRRRTHYTPSTVESDSFAMYEDSLMAVHTSASTPAHIGEAAMAREFEKYGEEETPLSPISIQQALGSLGQMEFMNRLEASGFPGDLGAVDKQDDMELTCEPNPLPIDSEQYAVDDRLYEMLESMSVRDAELYAKGLAPTSLSTDTIAGSNKGAPTYMAQVDNPSHLECQQMENIPGPVYEGQISEDSYCVLPAVINRPAGKYEGRGR